MFCGQCGCGQCGLSVANLDFPCGCGGYCCGQYGCTPNNISTVTRHRPPLPIAPTHRRWPGWVACAVVYTV